MCVLLTEYRSAVYNPATTHAQQECLLHYMVRSAAGLLLLLRAGV
jgi:hypothetical protein